MLIQLAKEGYDIKLTDHGKYLIENFNINIGNGFSITGVLKTSNKDNISVLFAKGEKSEGHYEVWLNYGELSFYAPDLNNNTSVYSGCIVADGKKHHFAIIYDGNY